MNYQEILLVINFIILFYIIYKINCLENDKIETFDATTDAAIRQAVNQVYTVDVDAIRSLSKFAIALTQGGMTVPGDLTIAGNLYSNSVNSMDDGGNGFSISGSTNKNLNRWLFNNYPGQRILGLRPIKADGSGWENSVFTMDSDGNTNISGKINTGGKTNYPTGWRGGVRAIDVYASGAYGLGDEDGNLITKIDNGGINTNIINVSGNLTANGPSKLSSLSVGGDALGGSQATFNDTTWFKGANNGNVSQSNPSHFPWSNGNNYISGNTIFRDGNVNFTGNSIKIGSWTIREGDRGHLQFIKDGTNHNSDYYSIPVDQGFVAMSQDGNIWVNKNGTKRGWVSNIVP